MEQEKKSRGEPMDPGGGLAYPIEVWYNVMTHADLATLLSLAALCRTLRRLARRSRFVILCLTYVPPYEGIHFCTERVMPHGRLWSLLDLSTDPPFSRPLMTMASEFGDVGLTVNPPSELVYWFESANVRAQIKRLFGRPGDSWSHEWEWYFWCDSYDAFEQTLLEQVVWDAPTGGESRSDWDDRTDVRCLLGRMGTWDQPAKHGIFTLRVELALGYESQAKLLCHSLRWIWGTSQTRKTS